MRDLIEQEKFELEVLDGLNSIKVLNRLIFVGGSMLRLCYELNRFSVDLDFWISGNSGCDYESLYMRIETFLKKNYEVTDSANKFNTLLFEIRSAQYPRRLKIKIRKKTFNQGVQAIAYSEFSTKQVLVNTLPLETMMSEKINAFLERNEIRDIFDVEFLVKKGVKLQETPETLKKLLNKIEKLSDNDYKVKLGSLIPGDQRKYYINNNFKILKRKINTLLS
ncbi:MAG: nucleotidyl transferase AbiEii/AbiGii toxin family protein [Elusimicrobiota bacterium]